MESPNKSMNKAPKHNSSDNNIDQSPEESGWTMYLEDFLLQNSNGHSCSLDNISGYESSLISDAGSSVNAAKKLAGDEEVNVRFGMNLSKVYCNRLSFKRRKTVEANLVDDALEDTASSPVNSPKVFNLTQMGVKPKEKNDDCNSVFEDKGIRTSGIKDNQSHEQLDGFIGRESGCTELKKRGLRLVPLSMLMNYTG